MKSLDTNILIYAVNSSCKEHNRARAIYEDLLSNPADWIVADQVLFEFFTALQNPNILAKPLSKHKALEQVRFLREESGAMCCAYEVSAWNSLVTMLGASKDKNRIIFDYVLAITLKINGVKTFYTRNKKDFESLDLFEVVNPI